jgi:hypothetical protein
MKKLMLIVGAIAFFTLAGQAVRACTCEKITGPIVLKNNVPKPGPEEVRKWRLEQTELAFFIGSVVKIEKVKVREKQSDGSYEHFPMKRVTVRVAKSWLGVKTPEMMIYTGVGGGDCGVPYVKGKQYFFLASRGRVTGLLETNICAPSKIDDPLVNDLDEVYGSATEFHLARGKAATA